MTHKENVRNIVANLPSPPKEFLDSCENVMQWFKEHNVDNLNKTLTRQNEPIVIYDLDEFIDGQKLEDDVNVTLSYGVLRKLTEESQKLDKYNSELCMELTITMDKLCLADKIKDLVDELKRDSDGNDYDLLLRISDLEDDLNNKDYEINELQGELEQLQKEIELKDDEIEKLKQDIKSLNE